MGADAFFAFYGVKFALDPDDETVQEACGMGTDPRCVAAENAGLQTFSGRMSEGEDCFLYVGQGLGSLGQEHEGHVKVAPAGLLALMARVDRQLAEAGFRDAPALHLQFNGQY